VIGAAFSALGIVAGAALLDRETNWSSLWYVLGWTVVLLGVLALLITIWGLS
jgi:hypothetical protein